MGLFDFWKLPISFSLTFGQKKPSESVSVVEEKQERFITGESNVPLPVSSGRSSQDEIATFIPGYKLREVPPDFAIEFFDTLQHLAAYNADFAYAVDNIVQLANTPHDIFFSDEVPESKQVEMKKWLKENESTWYPFSGGRRGLKADLLVQAVVFGAVSGENVPTKKLDNIDQIYRVPLKTVRFVKNEKDKYEPYQRVSWVYSSNSVNGLVKLNQSTYTYIALRRIFNSPYPVPPLITAIEGLVIQKNMMANFSEIMKKLGMLGFLTANVASPIPKKGESDEMYWKRCEDYLDNYVYPQLKKNLGTGVVAGFKESYEFKLEGNNMNVAGAEGLMKLVQLIIFSGLKQDPNMLGRNYSTTETFGRVILAKLLSQVEDYQNLVDTYFESLYLLALRLAGFNPGYVQVVSQKPLVSDRYKDEQAEGLRIDNAVKKRDEGFISQKQAAQELDYDKPYLDEAPAKQDSGSGSENANGQKDNAPEDDETIDSNEAISRLGVKHKSHVIEYDYSSVGCGNVTKQNFMDYTDFGDPKLNKMMKSYFSAINKRYVSAIQDISVKMRNKYEALGESTPIEQVQSEMYLTILQYWESSFTSKITGDIKSNVSNIYGYFRGEKDIFGFDKEKRGQSFDDIPDPVFGLSDFRAMEYMEKSDTMYLGKFITDKDTKSKVYRYFYDNYIDGGGSIGKSKNELKKFFDEFKELMGLEAWKIRRIIDTSVSKIRNFANVNYMEQAAVEEYEVIELVDQLTCDYCRHMNGKRFKVSAAVNKMNNEISAGPESVGMVSPFVTTIKFAEFSKLSDEQLNDRGFIITPFHCHCRGRTVAAF